MLEYNLLGQTVTFGNAAERYYDLQFSADQACLKVSREFNAWYKQSGDIKTVLDNYLPFVDSQIEELAFRPLYDQLTACEIYDMSEESYWERRIYTGSIRILAGSCGAAVQRNPEKAKCGAGVQSQPKSRPQPSSFLYKFS